MFWQVIIEQVLLLYFVSPNNLQACFQFQKQRYPIIGINVFFKINISYLYSFTLSRTVFWFIDKNENCWHYLRYLLHK